MSRFEKKERIMRYKLAYTGLILFIYIIGRCMPLYKVDVSVYTTVVDVEDVLMQTIGGNAYRSSVFALGIFPHMISTLLVQIFMALRGLFIKVRVSPKKISRISVALALIIAILQSLVQVPALKFIVTGRELLEAQSIAMVETITGAMIIMWLSNRNAKYGVGGRMILGIVNILEGMISTIVGHSLQKLVVPLAVSVVVLIIVLLMENAEKRIPVQRISIHNIYADKNYMAIKLNPAGVMPVMFATALFMLPQLLFSFLADLFPQQPEILWCQENMSLTRPLGIIVYIICEYLLTIGFSLLMISPKDITEQFLKSGDSIVDLHAGRDTRRYLRKVMWWISLFSATILGACVAVPLILQLSGDLDSMLVMLPSSIMMLTGLWCMVYRELIAIRNYDACQPFL